MTRSVNSFEMEKETFTHIFKQTLSIMADNASNNVTMIEELRVLLKDFPGPANQTRCFLHILSITAKSIIKKFDAPKVKSGTEMDNAVQRLADIAEEIESEDLDEDEDKDNNEPQEDDRPLDLWVDANSGLTEDQQKNIKWDIKPVHSMLMKVS
jgi:hypothetical protein